VCLCAREARGGGERGGGGRGSGRRMKNKCVREGKKWKRRKI